ncbi:MAG: hypothetical protein PHW79_03135 [Candidatus Marinimicrobia bacterium]|nr:hypothetical protein [Candidatus Neomarinimicrobiota bacterium]
MVTDRFGGNCFKAYSSQNSVTTKEVFTNQILIYKTGRGLDDELGYLIGIFQKLLIHNSNIGIF